MKTVSIYRCIRYALSAGLLFALIATTAPAHAAFPGINGKIAFQTVRDGNGEIYVMNPDGTGLTNLSNNPAGESDPSWSPDGTKIVFISNRDGHYQIYSMNADGSGQTNLSNNLFEDVGRPSWSPDGTRIAFMSVRDGSPEIYVMNADGSNQTRLTNNTAFDNEPVWSPDGGKIAFFSNTEIYVMNEDGSGAVNITNNPANDAHPSWSPDGSKIAFYTDRDGNWEVYVMNADGSAPVNLSNNGSAMDILPAWSPDGTKISFYSNRDGNGEVYVMNTDGTGQTNLTNNPAEDSQPNWQPITTVPSAFDVYLHGTGSSNNPPNLFLDNIAPTAATAKYKDSSNVNFNGGNPWKDVGTWASGPTLSDGDLTALSDLHVWLGLKNSDDQGTRFDLRAEVYENSTLVASSETYCITGVTRNPSLAKEVISSFGSFPPVSFNGVSDTLTLKIKTRVGTNGSGVFCGGHSNAVGLRLYFDAATQPSRFDVVFEQ